LSFPGFYTDRLTGNVAIQMTVARKRV